ncbi:MAG: sulfur carrier protein ThiS [Sulfurovum sp.]|nr:sulfur carrier protein ThiS [Sulfurovum sp.]MCB4745258.1 sulfur carrier protein ThiS [Sulfurovum sp.]MCB4746748.1 sulfur carrier protein ThiS [Sulfurovum sp.]MCB4747616.1 sulfur carrier protein ThiS [Sulfurovum sp.]MCB4749328.1 sulfur carrier protein ThiS [Sulfurovum sp.]
MYIILNGESKVIEPQTTITHLMKQFNYEIGIGAVAVNMVFIASGNYDKTILKEGDKVEVLAPVCGG